MSFGNCKIGGNNIYKGFPSIMADGRSNSNWLRANHLDEEIKIKNNIKTNNEYRQFLQENSHHIKNENLNRVADGCLSNKYLKNHKTACSPFLYSGCLDNSKPNGYHESDLKNLYLSRYELNNRLVTPYISQNELINYTKSN